MPSRTARLPPRRPVRLGVCNSIPDWLAPKDRFEVFREEFALKYLKLEITPDTRDNFWGRIDASFAGPVVVSSGGSTPSEARRTPKLASLSEDGVAVFMLRRGNAPSQSSRN